MTKRKAISKRVRFEVFKRDSFTCQYCGLSAPDVVLHIDHINPVAGGGGNDIMNLVTSCLDCNLGKGKRELDDKTAIAKQKAQLDELNKRREQLEMLLSWREGLSSITEQEIDAVNDRFELETNTYLNAYGRSQAKKWIKRNGLPAVLDALDAALETYYKAGDPEDADENRRLGSVAFNMIPRIIAAKKRDADKPWMRDLYYIRGIIRNRCYCNDRKAIELLEEAYEAGIHIDDLKQLALTTTSWTSWHRTLRAWIDEDEG
jgi:hypothetical protein